MSALALCLNDIGEKVIGSDSNNYYFTEEKLKEKNIPILIFNKNNIKEDNKYIYIISYAYNENNNEEVKKIFENNYQYYYYGDFINNYFNNIKIGVSGTHGKTTTTTLLKTLFYNNEVSYIIGDGNGKGVSNSKYLIFEACEYQQHFLSYNYDYLIINNIDYDHPDYYNNINEVITAFNNVSKKAKNIIINNDDSNCNKIKYNNKYTFGIKNDSFVTGEIVQKDRRGYKLKVKVKKDTYYFDLPFFGEYMIYNFLASFTMFYLTHNINKQTILYLNNELKKYNNPKRRKEEIVLKNNNIIIDDYAHHPTAIKYTYDAIKEKYEDYDITIVFQPHTYSRTIFLYKEFQEVFKNKNVYIMKTYKSREKEDLLKEETINGIFKEQNKYNINDVLKLLEKPKKIVLFMGAGDIYKEINKVISKINCKL